LHIMAAMKHLDTLAPVLALIVFAALVPRAFPLPDTASSERDCLTLTGASSKPGPAGPDLLERCSALNPKDVELLAALGAAYEATKATAKAEAIYRRALALDPDYAELRLRTGRLLLARGAAAEAAAQARLGLQIQPNRSVFLELQTAAAEALQGSAR